MASIYKDELDLTYLEWTKTRHSSGTAGSFLKAYEKRDGYKAYYKLSNYDSSSGIVGHESINELIVDRLLTYMGIEHLEYELINARIVVNGRTCNTYLCRSYDFKHKGESKIALDTLYEYEHEPEESPLAFCINRGWEDYIYSMLSVDYLIMNRDRHGANIEILKNRNSRCYRPAPLFDHGLSLMCACRTDEEFAVFDPMCERPVQCFVGGNSTLDNLNLIPKDRMIEMPVFDDDLCNSLFENLEGIVSDIWKSQIWNFLCRRAETYENIRNQKC